MQLWQFPCSLDVVAVTATQAADNSTASDATETTASADNQASGEDVTIEFWTIDLKAKHSVISLMT